MSSDHVSTQFDFTASYSSAVVPPGTIYEVNTKTGDDSDVARRKYVFCYNAGADTIAAGDVVAIFSVSAFTYGSVTVTTATTADYTDATTVRCLVAGVAGASAATTTYLWLWYSGYGTHSITTDGNVAVYNGLLCADGAKIATPNTTAASAHHACFGISLAADSSTTLSEAVLGGPGMFNWG